MQEFVLASDEAGFGAWAGPLTVAAVLVPRTWTPTVKVRDSKTLSEAVREASFQGLLSDPSVIHVILSVDPEAIDTEGVYPALLRLHTEAQEQAFLAAGRPQNVERIVDGVIPVPLARSLPKADKTIPACSAASIFAKVTRDREMTRFDALHPGYGFAAHKGYGVAAHEAALRRFGPCAIHRRSYAPVAQYARAADEPQYLWEILGDDE